MSRWLKRSGVAPAKLANTADFLRTSIPARSRSSTLLPSSTAAAPCSLRWEGPYLVGRTPVGRVTVEVLAMNDPVRVALRQELIDEDLWPPSHE
jgi:hypothetical protein